MNILSVVEVLGPGGAETALIDIVAGLRDDRHVVWHFSRSNATRVFRPNARRLAAAGATVRDVHWRTVAESAARDHALAGFRPDVVLLHWWGNEPWAPWLIEARSEHDPPAFVCILHSARVTISPGYDRYVLVAAFQRAMVPHLAGADVRVIGNGVDLDRFAAASRASRSRATEELVIGILARLRPRKVSGTLIRDVHAWPIPAARWVIAGDGPLRATLEADARQLAPAGNFRFAGDVPRRSVPRYLRGLDVLCHLVDPQTSDSNPIAVIEALAAGVPVVAERRGGLPELIEHGDNGLLAEDLDGVGEHLHTLANDRALLRRLAAGARRSALRFDRRRQLAAYREMLRSLEVAA